MSSICEEIVEKICHFRDILKVGTTKVGRVSSLLKCSNQGAQVFKSELFLDMASLKRSNNASYLYASNNISSSLLSSDIRLLGFPSTADR